AVEKPAVWREDEVVRDGRAEVELPQWRGVAVFERGDRQNAHVLRAADLAERRRERRPVGRHIEVVHDSAVRDSMNLGPFAIRWRDADDRAEAVQLAYTPERLVGCVERQVAHSKIFLKKGCAMRLRIERVEIAVLRVIGREEEDAGFRISRERGDRVDRWPLDVDEPLHAAGLDGDRTEMPDHPWVVEARVDGARC